jgi:hypothetical protein
MNRAIALFVALAMLLAHTLAIHDLGEGSLAAPYDQAYVALRMGRNLVFDGQLAWNPGRSAFESYPSALWVLVCAAAERVAPTLRLSTNLAVQSVGILASLTTLVVLSRFRRERVASLIAPLFLAASGAFAAAAASGLETAAFTLIAAGAFLALERGRTAWLALLLALLVLARTEGALLAGAMAVVRALGRPEPGDGAARRAGWIAFAAPAAVFALTLVARFASTGFLLSGETVALVQPLPGQWAGGMKSLSEFALVAVTPLLLAFPALCLLRGSLSHTGSHAVFLALSWFALCVLRGRGPLPFHEAFVPSLPFLCIAVQEGMIAALDGVSALRRRATLLVFALALFGSALASRMPANLGPLPLQDLHERWVSPSGSARHGFEQTLGRMGLVEELEVTRRLRRVGIFLRDHAEPGTSVLTPWPGAVGYLSRHVVHDALGRASPRAPNERPGSWSRRERADVVAALALDADFAVPTCRIAARLPTLDETARAWLEGLDAHPDRSDRLGSISAALARYDLVLVPVEDYTRQRVSLGRELFPLLRHRRLSQRPALTLEIDRGSLRVLARHARHPQVADLEVRLEDESGKGWCLSPTGIAVPGAGARARVGLLLYAAGARGIELMRNPVPAHPAGGDWRRISARLVNPGSAGLGEPWEEVSEAVSAAL